MVSFLKGIGDKGVRVIANGQPKTDRVITPRVVNESINRTSMKMSPCKLNRNASWSRPPLREGRSHIW